MEQSKKERFMQLYAPVHDRFERYCKTRAYGEFHFKDIMHDTLLVAYENFDKIKIDSVLVCHKILSHCYNESIKKSFAKISSI